MLAQEESVVTAHEVKGKVDYKKLVEEFGCSLLPESLVDRIERVTGVPAHPFLKRGVFYAHRDLEKILDLHEAGKKFYLYTGGHQHTPGIYLIYCKAIVFQCLGLSIKVDRQECGLPLFVRGLPQKTDGQLFTIYAIMAMKA